MNHVLMHTSGCRSVVFVTRPPDGGQLCDAHISSGSVEELAVCMQSGEVVDGSRTTSCPSEICCLNSNEPRAVGLYSECCSCSTRSSYYGRQTVHVKKEQSSVRTWTCEMFGDTDEMDVRGRRRRRDGGFAVINTFLEVYRRRKWKYKIKDGCSPVFGRARDPKEKT